MTTQPDPARVFCEERCAGDPPCYELDRREGKPFTPCTDCLRDCGIEVPEPLDPEAAVRNLI